MCQNCGWEDAVGLVDLILERLPRHLTVLRGKARAAGERIDERRCVTGGELKLLHNIARPYGIPISEPRTAPIVGSPTNHAVRFGPVGAPRPPVQAAPDAAPPVGRPPRRIIFMPPKCLMEREPDVVRAAEAAVRTTLRQGDQLFVFDGAQWENIRKQAGGWDKMYGWCADKYDALAVVETPDGGLARGGHDAADLFRKAGKSVVAVRCDGSLVAVDAVEPWRPENRDGWRRTYGRISRLRDGSPVVPPPEPQGASAALSDPAEWTEDDDEIPF